MKVSIFELFSLDILSDIRQIDATCRAYVVQTDGHDAHAPVMPTMTIAAAAIAISHSTSRLQHVSQTCTIYRRTRWGKKLRDQRYHQSSIELQEVNS
jgi:hypothetical protein